ncbi:MAG: Hsp20/alpha crystallin family protein [Anaerolineales bacterium]
MRFSPISIWTNKDGQLNSVETPGIHPDDLDIDVTGDEISISGPLTFNCVSPEVLKSCRRCNFPHCHTSNERNRKLLKHRMVDTKSKFIKLALVCLLCISLVIGLVNRIQFLTA